MKRRLANMSMRSHLALAFGGLTLLISAGLLFVAGVSARHYLREQLRQKLMAIASEAAQTVDPDLLAEVKSRADEDGAAYLQIKRRLRELRDERDIRYIYTMRANSDPEAWRFIVDAEDDPKLVSHVGDLYDVSDSPEMWNGLRGPAADYTLTSDQWGWWLSGYAPIRDRHGHTVALLGVDMSATEVIRQEGAVLRAVLIGLVACLCVSGVLADRFARAFCGPIAALAEATRRVAQGELATEVRAWGSHELITLEQSFNQMTRAIKEQEDRLVELSNTDCQTSLYNHRYFRERLEQEMGRAARYGRPVSLAMLDLDLFHEVNAVHGHQGGDDVLRQIAELIKGALRHYDIATRYGGDEFAIIMPETSRDDACLAAERVRQAIEAHTFKIRSLDGPAEVRLTVSQGIAEFPLDSRQREGLVAAADLALFRAKHISRNRTCVYSEGNDHDTERLDPVHLHRTLQDPSLAAVESLSQAMDARDHHARGHSENVTRLAMAVAQAMGMSPDTQMKLRIAGLLHDVGKIGIPDKVLFKADELTQQEWDLIRAHPSLGASILAKAPLLWEIIPIVAGHHERYDGAGYPDGAMGEEIPLGARILAVADAYDAMTSYRPYRPAMTREQALEELRDNAGRQFDPKVVAAFEQIAELLAEDVLAAAGPEDFT